MRIAAIDTPLRASSVLIVRGGYFERLSLAQSDVLLWQPERLHRSLAAQGFELDLPTSASLFATTRHWRREINDLLARGGTIVTFLAPQTHVRAHHFEDVIEFDLLEALGEDPPRTAPLVPPAPTAWVPGGEPFFSFFDATRHLFLPGARVVHARGETILGDGEGRALACYETRAAGRLLYLPALAHELGDEDAKILTDALTRLVARLRGSRPIVNAHWLQASASRQRRATEQAVRENENRIVALQKENSLLQARLQERAFFEQLVAGTGAGVYRAVVEALRASRITVEQDWLDESLLLASGKKRTAILKTLLPGESLDAMTLAHIAAGVGRVTKEYRDSGGEAPDPRVIIIDCRANAQALAPGREGLSAGDVTIFAAQRWQRVTGVRLYVCQALRRGVAKSAPRDEDAGNEAAADAAWPDCPWPPAMMSENGKGDEDEAVLCQQALEFLAQ